ncbi:leucine-rich repeat-containing protein 19-like [Genypterus blacodes]|uniref:leucine-rich repeat-containing protein 19-like n=1 Tax=Genypterus blacodes TaxID=154954 RepID=UPI003F75A2B7
MAKWHYCYIILWITVSATVDMLGHNATAEDDNELVKNLTNKSLQVIPNSDCNVCTTELIVKGNQITLNEVDQLALATYHNLTEVHLDRNLVTTIGAKYFSVVPHLTVLSLSRNKITRLDPEAFSGLEVLMKLDLSHNLLATLHSQQFRGLNKLQVILVDLQENPWNCSCQLWNSIGKMKTSGTTFGNLSSSSFIVLHSNIIFLLIADMPIQIEISTTGTFEDTATFGFQQCVKDLTPVLGNTWKFTACVAAIALSTSMLIMCAIKGPSWYMLFSNYRHRQLCEEDDEEEVDRTVYANARGTLNHDLDVEQTFTYQQDNRFLSLIVFSFI